MGYYDDEEDDDDEDKKVRDLMSEHEAGDLNESDAEKLYSNYDVSTTYEHSPRITLKDAVYRRTTTAEARRSRWSCRSVRKTALAEATKKWDQPIKDGLHGLTAKRHGNQTWTGPRKCEGPVRITLRTVGRYASAAALSPFSNASTPLSYRAWISAIFFS